MCNRCANEFSEDTVGKECRICGEDSKIVKIEQEIVYHYYCSHCGKDLTSDTYREDAEVCPDCGGKIRTGHKPDNTIQISSDGDIPGFFCHELGLIGKQQEEYKSNHPDAVFNNKGALYIRSPRHLKEVLHEKGMVTLTDSREYNDQHREMLERGRDGEFDKKNNN